MTTRHFEELCVCLCLCLSNRLRGQGAQLLGKKSIYQIGSSMVFEAPLNAERVPE